ncbi:MAG: Flp family type IVb pilin [Acidimicrobiia bacterium]
MNLFMIRSWLSASLSRDEHGANLVEYILLVSLIALAVIAAVMFMSGELSGSFDNAGSRLSNTPNP